MRQRLVVARPAWRGWRVVGPPLLLCGCAALFVGSDVVERHLFPDLTTGWRHFLLTARSAVVTGMGSAIVYLIMRRQQNQLTTTARQLSQLLETYRANPHTRVHFDNPHLVHCRDVFSCQRVACPAHSAPTARCWQVAALSSHARDGDGPVVTIQQCHECEVYRLSCPDGMTQLGESLNNLMFLLDEEAQQLRRIQGQMVEREKLAAIGQMAAGIAHEIGNPLSSISAIVQVLKRRHPDASQAEQFDLIQAHIQRISSTVRQLSGLARPSPERWEPVDLLSTLQESVRLVGFDRRAKDTRIVFAPPASLPRTWALRAQLQQVFINILLNALDAMESGGELTVRVEGRPRSIAFVFEDTGCGIPAAIGRRVFEPFYSTKEPGRGTGLGLAVSYAIVRKHGGTIEFAPRNGGGTVFRVELPILSESPDE
jgi:signal transduction histidine kinase